MAGPDEGEAMKDRESRLATMREQHIASGKCREPMVVMIAWTRWCDNKAKTSAGYCKVHDPDCKRERAKNRWRGRR